LFESLKLSVEKLVLLEAACQLELNISLKWLVVVLHQNWLSEGDV